MLSGNIMIRIFPEVQVFLNRKRTAIEKYFEDKLFIIPVSV